MYVFIFLKYIWLQLNLVEVKVRETSTKLEQWFDNNNLKLNISKTSVIIVRELLINCI